MGMRKAKRLLSPSRLALITGGFLGLGLVSAGPAQADLSIQPGFLKIDGLDVPPVVYVIPTAGNQVFTLGLSATITGDASQSHALFDLQGDFTQTLAGAGLSGAMAADGAVIMVREGPPPVMAQAVAVTRPDPLPSFTGNSATGGTVSAGGDLLGVAFRHTPTMDLASPPKLASSESMPARTPCRTLVKSRTPATPRTWRR